MRFPAPLIPATLVKRYKRFLADVTLPTGETVTAHVANPGSMIGLAAPRSRVWLSKSDNPNRKLSHSWELIEVDLGGGPELVGVNTAHPNPLVGAALAAGAIPELAGYDTIRREVEQGTRAVMLYLIQIGSAARFSLACDIDPKYGAAFDRARSRGVEAIAWKCRIDCDGIEIDCKVPIVE